jgi:Cu+-exporting ATPase
MLLSVSSYLGLDAGNGQSLRRLFGCVSFILAVPVLIYSAADYWRAAWLSLRRRAVTIEVPIAAGLVAFFAQSVLEVVSGRGSGYFDSLTGLVFFLLCGKWFQQKTFERLAFDRDYKSFFPLSVTREDQSGENHVALSQVVVGDRLILRNGELIPADARLVSGQAVIDYSFVTGEAEPVDKSEGDYLYAGGRQVGQAIAVETVKPVSQSYLTSLWNRGGCGAWRGHFLVGPGPQPGFAVLRLGLDRGLPLRAGAGGAFWARFRATSGREARHLPKKHFHPGNAGPGGHGGV